MIFQWLLSLTSTYKIPAFFFYTSSRMAFACITTLLFTLLMGPLFLSRLYHLKVGHSIRGKDYPILGELQQKKQETPTMGGLLFLTGMLVSLLLWMDFRSVYTFILLIVTLSFGTLGAVDDYFKIVRQHHRGIPSRVKFLIQCALGFSIACYLYFPSWQAMLPWHPPVGVLTGHVFSLSHMAHLLFIPFLKTPFFIPTFFGLFLAVFVIVGTCNAVNLTDGLDGLASGAVLFATFVFAIVAFLSNHLHLAKYLHLLYIENSGEIAIYLAALFGGVLGFLWYNSYPAQVFMGDVGSLTLGAILGMSSVLLRKEFLLALVGGLFVIEALSVIIQVIYFRCTGGKRIFLCSPLHHHFEFKGIPERKVVIRMWILGLTLAIIGLLSIKFQ